jgi:hypothetical protein
VNPVHSRKMTARLQAATSSGLPILLRTTATAGHGMGSSLKDRVAEQADISMPFSFRNSVWTPRRGRSNDEVRKMHKRKRDTGFDP